MPLCEIRIPTYRRPNLLRRALSCVAAQTEHDLRCIVFDDSPDREGETVVAEFPQLDIDYRPNPKNLGISRNLGQCFQTRAFRSASYAFCLEDDNTIDPTFIEENILLLRKMEVSIVVRDQRILESDGTICRNTTTCGKAFIEGVHSKESALLALFLSAGLPNGSLFWSTSAQSELCVGLDCPDPAMQERFRPFAFREPWVFAAKPLAAYNADLVGSFRVQGGNLAQAWANRWRRVGILRVRRYGISKLQLAGMWPQALGALTPNTVNRVECGAAFACRPVSWRRLTRWSLAKRYAAGLVAMTLRGPNLGPSFERLLADGSRGGVLESSGNIQVPT